METLHARYPFLDGARAAVRAADVDLGTAIAEEEPVVERALDRVRSAIEDGDVGDPHPTDRVELLSYPVARVLVSLVDEPGLVDRYARAEASTAFERLRRASDEERELRSVTRETLGRDDLLRELDLDDAVGGLRPETTDSDGAIRVDVTAYLDLTAGLDDERWSLPKRSLADGRVGVSREEFDRLLEEAIRGRIAADLPLDVPDSIAAELEAEIEAVRTLLADIELSWDVGAVEPDVFPPCVQALLSRVDEGGEFEPHSRFALVSFLATAGMASEAIVDRVADHPDVTEDEVEEQIAHLREEDGSAYPPPSCATMQAYGDCVNRDALCFRIAHPLDYYERRLRGDDPEDYAERRDSQ